MKVKELTLIITIREWIMTKTLVVMTSFTALLIKASSAFFFGWEGVKIREIVWGGGGEW